MKRIISILFLILSFSFVPKVYAEDKVVAIVNNEIITQKDLNDFLNFIRMQYMRQLKGRALEEKVSSMRQDLLRRLIDDRLMLQKAKGEKITIEPAKIKAKINEIKKGYGNESDFERDLAKQGLVQADLENKIRDQMLTFIVIENKVRSKIIISPDEVTNFYNDNKNEFLKPEERLLTVFILQDNESAKNFGYQLRLGTKVEELATRFKFTMDIFTASQGEQLRSEIEGAVFKLGLNEVSNPIVVGDQFYVFKLDNIIAGRQMSLSEAQEKVQAYLFGKKLQEELGKWLDEIKKNSYIKIFEG